MKKPFWIVPSMLAVLAACTASNITTTPTTTVVSSPAQNTRKLKTVGLLEVTMDFRDENNPIVTADFKPLRQKSAKPGTLGANSVVSYPYDQLKIKLRRRSVGFIDDNELSPYGTPMRYVRGTFEIANDSGFPYANMYFIGYNQSGNQNGTMFTNLTKGDGTPVLPADTLPGGLNTYRALKPTHGMRYNSSGRGGVEVDPQYADLQVFGHNTYADYAASNPNTPPLSSDEVGSVQYALHNDYPGRALEYGFVARNFSGGRLIGTMPTPSGQTCNVGNPVATPPVPAVFTSKDCFTGQVTFAFKFPSYGPTSSPSGSRQSNPFLFSYTLAIAEEAVDAYATQSLEEQPDSARVSAAIPGVNNRWVNVLRGGTASFGSLNPTYAGRKFRTVCDPVTAGPSGAFTGVERLGSKPALRGISTLANDPFTLQKIALSSYNVVDFDFCDEMYNPNSNTLVFNSSRLGKDTNSSAFQTGGASSTYFRTTPFYAGEELEVTLTRNVVRPSDFAEITPSVHRFRTPTSQSAVSIHGYSLVNTPTGQSDYTISQITTGDFNNDGKLDTITVNGNEGNTSILLGNNAGGFVPSSDSLRSVSGVGRGIVLTPSSSC
jgi:hypothetical protein